jgi:hypothetical protein
MESNVKLRKISSLEKIISLVQIRKKLVKSSCLPMTNCPLQIKLVWESVLYGGPISQFQFNQKNRCILFNSMKLQFIMSPIKIRQ